MLLTCYKSGNEIIANKSAAVKTVIRHKRDYPAVVFLKFTIECVDGQSCNRFFRS